MRILLLTPVFPPARGGIETVAGRLAELLVSDVLVVALAPGGCADASGGAARSGLRVIRVHNEPRGGRRSIARLNGRALLAGLRFRPDVILSMHVKTSPAGRALGRLLHVPYVQYVHANEMREVPALARFAVEHADAIVAVSRYSRELALEVGADPARITIVPNGVDMPPAAPIERDPVPTILTISRLEQGYKGHDIVLGALPAIRAAVPDVRWVVIGDGVLRPALERMAAENGLRDTVRFLGSVDDRARDEWLHRARVFVMPTRQPAGRWAGEGFGIVYLEAAAYGLPVVAGRVPGVVDAVIDGVTGLLVDPSQPAAVAAATVRILTDDELAGRLGAAGSRRASELRWPTIASRVQQLLEEVVAAGGRPPQTPPTSAYWRWLRDLVKRPLPPDP